MVSQEKIGVIFLVPKNILNKRGVVFFELGSEIRFWPP